LADRSLIAHLFRRAGFGARPADLDYYETRDYRVAVDELVSGMPLREQQPALYESTRPTVLNPAWNVVGRVINRDLGTLQNDWMQLMAVTTTPLVERMTLMLHDHFATGYSPGDNIDTTELNVQNELFRTNALGNWKTLCHAMLEDVALGMWLDTDLNFKDAPNENLARELMELFVLGVNAGYTERDVREAARALTGYILEYNLEPLGPRNRLRWIPELHDASPKTILGTTGPFTPHDLVDLLLAHPAASRHLARRLAQTFVMPNPSSAYVERIAAVLRTNGWEMKPALVEIFTSGEFAASRGTIVKSPAEFAVALLRALDRTEYGQANYWMQRAGQILFAPPNVGGWVPNEGWLSAGFLLARYNAAVELATLNQNAFRIPGQVPLRGTTVAQWGEIFGLTELGDGTRSSLDGYLTTAQSKGYTEPAIDHAMITLIVSSPDFSLA
jgi:uncharacterized protein (DUF1800 family)